jgi:hypothetical protein
MNKTKMESLEAVLVSSKIKGKSSGLKGYFHKIFTSGIFSFLYRLSPGLWYRSPTFNLFNNSRRHSPLKIHHRTGGRSLTGVIDTGGKFTIVSSTPIVTPFSRFLCNGGQHYVPYRWLLISNKLCDSIFYVTEEPFMHLTVSCRFLI